MTHPRMTVADAVSRTIEASGSTFLADAVFAAFRSKTGLSWTSMARRQAANGRSAEDLLRRGLVRFPGDSRIVTELAWLLSSEGRDEDALALVKEARQVALRNWAQPKTDRVLIPLVEKAWPGWLALSESVIETAVVRDQPRGHTIFTFWGSGWDQAPALVQRIRQEYVRLGMEESVVRLDSSNYRDWATDLPPAVEKLAERDVVKFTNSLRFELLRVHGGYWLDATVLPRYDIRDILPVDATRPFVAVGESKSSLNGGVAFGAMPGTYTARAMSFFLSRFWHERQSPPEYLFTWRLLTIIALLDQRVMNELQGVVTRYVPEMHALSRLYLAPSDETLLRSILNQAPVHKLNWKTAQSAPRDPRYSGSTLALLLDLQRLPLVDRSAVTWRKMLDGE